MRCEGIPTADGLSSCPHKVCDNSVKNCQGDLFLCPSCKNVRFPAFHTNQTKSAKNEVQPKKTRGGVVPSPKPVSPSPSSSSAPAARKKRSSRPTVVKKADTLPQTPIIDTVITSTANTLVHSTAANASSVDKDAGMGQASRLSTAIYDDEQCAACSELQSKLIVVEDQVSQLIAKVAELEHKLNSKLENSTCVSHLVDCSKTAASNTGVSHPVHTVANMTAASMSDLVKLEVCRTLQDVNKHKLNVVVSGIPEMGGNCYNDSDDGDNRKHDCDAFIQFCEENLAVKPPLGHKGCKRLGKRIDHRPRKLLVHLTSETSAANLMTASKTLRRTAETANFYINPDLSPAEAQVAYELWQKRRATVAQCTSCSTKSGNENTTTVADIEASVAQLRSCLSANSVEFVPLSMNVSSLTVTNGVPEKEMVSIPVSVPSCSTTACAPNATGINNVPDSEQLPCSFRAQ